MGIGQLNETSVPLKVELAEQLFVLLLIDVVLPFLCPILPELLFREEGLIAEACCSFSVEDAVCVVGVFLG